MNGDVVIGVDAGGTATRCVVAALDGRMLGRGRAGGANQYSSADPAAALALALGEALAAAPGVAAAAVAGAVFGIAGASGSGHARAEAAVLRAWRDLGLPGGPEVTDDIAVAFASGSAAPAGTVLIAGTGAVAAHVRDGAVARRCDGHGWLLGDEGSAVWIALAGLRAVLASLDGRGRATVLRGRLAAALETEPGDAQSIIRAVHALPPAELGRLAPEVTRAALEGDAAAESIVAGAAESLLTAFRTVAPEPPAADPVVLAGSVLREGPVAEAVRRGLGERFGVHPLDAADGALGAAGLALRRAGAPATAHSRLLEP
ncbi:N-acetylglucosamine kinase-like BadF-type ATPase [Spinactinospora alkalitolerans]|uniref:N-acetylglucosamine kinase-like BadF-type ATPase n=1 Tax=Spinactinospora alkalitolerans TaxID=687207 RepID=A0A852U5C9_9ACTN|nr:BadF/BadG/BcrA/BcrD ATPase family protein [Spinactinospora alkalitolerans]NYE49284.1 N-acetylglucosamine kinase-like BadF-type ATPase [Spinactinospora alkalitolerans]